MPLDPRDARTSVAAARVGALTTYGRHPSGQRTVAVAVQPQDDGSVHVELARDAEGVAQLLARPYAALEVAPVGCAPVLLHGPVRRLPGTSDSGALRFALVPAVVRAGAASELVDERAYAAAVPDRVAGQATAVLAHLNTCHAEALAACLRAAGHRADWAAATGVDAGGLTVLAVTADGVDTVRLRFPQPVAALSDLPVSLSTALDPDCGCRSRSR